jgi:hypothetical protein
VGRFGDKKEYRIMYCRNICRCLGLLLFTIASLYNKKVFGENSGEAYNEIMSDIAARDKVKPDPELKPAPLRLLTMTFENKPTEFPLLCIEPTMKKKIFFLDLQEVS